MTPLIWNKIPPSKVDKQFNENLFMNDMIQKRKFWMVYVEGQSNPVYKHYERIAAETECKRLTKMLGREAFLLESVGGYKVVDVMEIQMLEGDDLPF